MSKQARSAVRGVIISGLALFVCQCFATVVPAEQKNIGAKQTTEILLKTNKNQVLLGPQPEPPDKPDKGSKALGPQPEPPDRALTPSSR